VWPSSWQVLLSVPVLEPMSSGHQWQSSMRPCCHTRPPLDLINPSAAHTGLGVFRDSCRSRESHPTRLPPTAACAGVPPSLSRLPRSTSPPWLPTTACHITAPCGDCRVHRSSECASCSSEREEGVLEVLCYQLNIMRSTDVSGRIVIIRFDPRRYPY
jgi:hypothetical protein